MLSAKPFTIGKLTGIIYDFAEVGDELGLHQHDETNNHITVVARGSFLLFGDDWKRPASAGEVLDWPPHQRHGAAALERNSRLVNIGK